MDESIEIPGYRVMNVLGMGGMASVYLGIQEKLNRKVAIKVLEPSFLKNEEIARRFLREAETAAGLSHSNIVQIFDTGKAGKYHFIAMEYLEESLLRRVKRSAQGRMHAQIALDIVEAIMKALDYAHLRGVYHRDIKPDNIMFRQDDTPVLTDFGIARVLGSPEDLTKSGQRMGSIYYMSPEQCKTEEIDGRSDIYSLGVVLFEILTGKKPYKGDTPVAVALQHVQKPPPRLPQELSRYQPLIDGMMAKEREQRVANVGDFVRLVDKVMTGQTPAPPTGKPSQIESQPLPPAAASREFSEKVTSLLSAWLGVIKEKSAPLIAKIKQGLAIFKKTWAKKSVKRAVLISFAVIIIAVIIITSLIESSNRQKRRDNLAFELAVSINSAAAYEKYLSEFPKGRHIEEITRKLNALKKEAAQRKQMVRLRSEQMTLAVDDIKSMIERYGFFESQVNKSGDFKSHYEKSETNSAAPVIDYTTGLLWYDGEPLEAMSFKNAVIWMESLNSRSYGGYDDWRLPSLEESVSLLRKDKNKKKLHIDAIFIGDQKSIWTNDIYSLKNDMSWIVNFDLGSITASFNRDAHQVRPVRSLK